MPAQFSGRTFRVGFACKGSEDLWEVLLCHSCPVGPKGRLSPASSVLGQARGEVTRRRKCPRGSTPSRNKTCAKQHPPAPKRKADNDSHASTKARRCGGLTQDGRKPGRATLLCHDQAKNAVPNPHTARSMWSPADRCQTKGEARSSKNCCAC